VPVEVERMVKRFDLVVRYARTLDDLLAEAEPAGGSPRSHGREPPQPFYSR